MKPQPTLTFEVINGEKITKFMSYGLLNELTRLLGEPTKVPSFEMDPYLADAILRVVTIPREPNGKPTDDLDRFVPPLMSPEEVFKVFDWVKGHVLDFFVMRLEAAAKTAAELKPQMEPLKSLLTGLES